MTSQPEDFWFNSMKRHQLLSPADTLKLARVIQRYRAKDRLHHAKARRAVNQLVEANLRLVPHAWNLRFARVIPSGDTRLVDMLQEGTLGLHRAAQLFDPTRGYSFSTYASFWIRKGFYDFLRNQNRTIRLPGHNWPAIKDLQDRSDLAFAEGRCLNEADLLEVGKRHKMKPAALRTVVRLERITSTSSLDHSQGDRDKDGGLRLVDMVASPMLDPDETERSEKAERLFDLVASRAHLDPEERFLVTCHADGLNYKDLERLYPELRPVQKRINAARRRMKKVATEIGSMASLSVA